MNKDAINQAMAELDGWKYFKDAWYPWRTPSGDSSPKLPHDYTEDLNAVARVVGRLDEYQKQQAQKTLRAIVIAWHDPRAMGELSWLGESKVCNATAMQRCEAILRACGKWVDG